MKVEKIAKTVDNLDFQSCGVTEFGGLFISVLRKKSNILYFNFEVQTVAISRKKFFIIFKMADLENFKFLIVFGFEHHHFAIFLKHFVPKFFELYYKSNFHY